ncbi:MAG: hypothetical protein SPK18_08015 [Treponema sp.]|nr:hypothetical protein [Treponema sp.]MDY5758509.1 hypothetical protein [Treponema sp.]
MKLTNDQTKIPIKTAEAVSSLHHSPKGEKIAIRIAAKISSNFTTERIKDFQNRFLNISRKIGFPAFREKSRRCEITEPA